ncbi:hypothetical protein [Legionella brunensis]|uniref:Uncharacterized protein n=1 Tax=Legionella brunensis TaxID=29422 RepID=A0A0W0SSE3_9GAMM|nr:hypothetical protein [Legionella brunensis]KTC86283.1 hypothetical protein Lbru_0777 [Legionella brunensis]
MADRNEKKQGSYDQQGRRSSEAPNTNRDKPYHRGSDANRQSQDERRHFDKADKHFSERSNHPRTSENSRDHRK